MPGVARERYADLVTNIDPLQPHSLPRAAALTRNRATGAFERRVAHALRGVASEPGPLLVACSGGPDSSAALVAVARTPTPAPTAPTPSGCTSVPARQAASGGEVIAATFDHGLRPPAETEADRAAVEALAATLGVRCLAGAPDEPIAPSEDAARQARYRWLGAAALQIGASACITGHTLDDQAETLLLRLTRGTGLAGASGMAPAAPWPVALDGEREAAPRLLRPLLELRREELLDYLAELGMAELGLAPRRDPGNETLVFDRNRVRRRVLPELRRLNPRAAEALAGFARRARRDDEALEAWAAAESARLVRVEGAVARIERAGLRALPEAVAARVLRGAAAGLGLTLTAVQLEELLRIAGRRGARIALGGGEARTEDTELRLERRGAGGG